MSTERRLLVRTLGAVGETLVLDEHGAHHVRVLRLGVGAGVTLFDGSGASVHAVIVATDPHVSVRVDAIRAAALGRVPIVLVQCLPKGGKLDDIVRAATELGVDAIRLASSDHAVAKSDERWERKQSRLLRVAEEASRQSERDDVPALFAPAPLIEHARAAGPGTMKLSLCGRSGSVVSGPAPEAGIWLVVGPEGGLSERELVALDDVSYTRASISPTILRVETAAVAALAVARHLAEADGDR